MKRPALLTLGCAALLAVEATAQPGGMDLLYSLDAGSDWETSDPIPNPIKYPGIVANKPATIDAGDLWLLKLQQDANLGVAVTPPQAVDPTTGQLVNYKDDTQTTIGAWPGHPFPTGSAGEPSPSLVGPNSVTGQPDAITLAVTSQYASYFDLDAEDQIDFSLADRQPGLVRLDPAFVPTQYTRQAPDQRLSGVYFQPVEAYFSGEDDGPGGWYASGQVPTVSGPERDDEIFLTPLTLNPGATPAQPWATEGQLGLDPPPSMNFQPGTPETFWDDDVDALDLHPDVDPAINEPDVVYNYRYWSADHEANADPLNRGFDAAPGVYQSVYAASIPGQVLDPGSIYMTVTNTVQPSPNYVKVLDQQTDIGLMLSWTSDQRLLDADIDAWEFMAVSPTVFQQVFGFYPGGSDDVLVGLFSVNQDDPDTPLIIESGGLPHDAIFMTDLNGVYVQVSGSYIEGIDALAVTLAPPLPGDTDGDYDIDDADLGNAFANYTGPLPFGTGGKTAADGDTDGDGDVDDADLGNLFAAYTGPMRAIQIPEPGTIVLMATAGAML